MIKLLICLLLGGTLLTGCAPSQPAAPAVDDMKPVEEEKADYIKITAEEAKAMMDEKSVVVVDVRTPEEYAEGHIDKAVLLPLSAIAHDAESVLLDKSATVLVYCRSGNRSKTASEELIEMGYKSVYDFGGIIDWPYEVVK